MCDISKFQDGYKKSSTSALREIQNGQKTSHWIWWVLPTPPYISQGIEIGSSINKKYAIRTDLEVVAFLWDPIIREKYIQLIQAILNQCSRGRSLQSLMANDSVKLNSHIRLFTRVAKRINDVEILGILQLFPVLCECQQ